MALSLNQAKKKKKKPTTQSKASNKKISKKKNKKIQPWQNKSLEGVEKVAQINNAEIPSSLDDSLFEGMEVYPENYTSELIDELKSLPWQSIRHPRKTAKRYSSFIRTSALSAVKKYLPKVF